MHLGIVGQAVHRLKSLFVKTIGQVPMQFVPLDFETGLQRLRWFKDIHGHTQVPHTFVDPTEFSLYNWTRLQRDRLKRGKLPADQADELMALGMIASISDERFLERLKTLKKAMEIHGTKVPSTLVVDGVEIGQWLHQTLFRASRNVLPKNHQKTLKELGFRVRRKVKTNTWSPAQKRKHQSRHATGLKLLRKYVATFSALPKSDTVFEGFKLGSWLSVRRRYWKLEKLSPKMIKDLQKLGVRKPATKPCKQPPAGQPSSFFHLSA